MTEHYSPLRYPGGKARIAGFLVEVLKGAGIQYPRYVEPYAGGAGAALKLLFEEYVEHVTINDADPRIRCFWEAITRKTEAFIEMVRQVPVTVEEWRRQRQVYERRDLRRVLALGFATFFLNRTTRSGIIHNGGPIGGYNQEGNYKIDARFNREQLVRRIHRVGMYSDRITVSGLDGLELLKSLEEDDAKGHVSFVYLDPPYYAKGDELYMNRFDHSDHASLAAYLSAQRTFPWLLTYDSAPAIRELYSSTPQALFSLSYSAYERRKGQEILMYPTSLSVPASALRCLPEIKIPAEHIA